MKVSDLAKILNTTDKFILDTLKSLKLKAKDGKQEISGAVVTVVKSEIKRSNKEIPPRESKVEKKIEPSIEEEVEVKNVTKKKDKKIDEKPAKKTTKTKTEKKTKAKPKTKTKEKKEATSDKKEKEAPKKKKTEKVIIPKEPAKQKSKISKEPLITLKPLSRRRKKTVAPTKDVGKAISFPKDKEDSGSLEGQELKQKDIVVKTGKVQPESQRIQESLDVSEKYEELKDIELKVPITVKELSSKLQQKPSVILKQLMQMGFFAHINQSLDSDIVKVITKKFGYNLTKTKTQEEQLIDEHKKEDDDPKLLKPRAPVITFMGHVDHGKTSLIDKIRKSKIADKEHGGITQHMSAYSVSISKGRITFLDTPGHEAFTSMRARGAHITDLVVLVVAADEGVMPQTEEAIDHARAANVPIVVALNKIDKRNADVDRVKKQLQKYDLAPEDWGGKTTVVGVSAVTGQGVDELLELILLESELLELKANPDKNASGIVVEAHLSQGKGAVIILIIQGGTLKEGDIIIVGSYYGKIRAMLDDRNRPIKKAGPSMPVEILGLPNVPEAGEMFYVVNDEKQAKEISFRRSEQLKNKKLNASQKISLEDLYSQLQEGTIKELNVILKADVQGSLEALKDSLEKIPSDKVKIKFIHSGLGDVNSSDVLLAVASKAIIIAFHVGIDSKAKKELGKEPVDVRQYRIIYDAVNDIKNALEGLLEAKTKKNFLSRVEIREVFKLSKKGIVAGCYVVKGKIPRKAKIDLIRDGEIIYSGSISSLKRFKDDVREVNEGMECGITIDGYDKIESGDIIEAYTVESIAQKL